MPQILEGKLLAHLSELLVTEAQDTAVGGSLVLDHLAQIVFVHMLRAHADQAGRPTGWLGALRDDGIGAALRALHADVAHGWTLKELSGISRMSRSAFAASFKNQVGSTPLEYLIEWRMSLARDALRRGTRSISELAFATGYESESASTPAQLDSQRFPTWLSARRVSGNQRASSGSTRDSVSWILASVIVFLASSGDSQRSGAPGFSGCAVPGTIVASTNRRSACSCASSRLFAGTGTITTCRNFASGQGTRSRSPVSSCPSRRAMASGSCSSGSACPPTSSHDWWRWCQRSSTRPLSGCTISADAVTCNGVDRLQGSPVSTRARTRSTSASSDVVLGR